MQEIYSKLHMPLPEMSNLVTSKFILPVSTWKQSNIIILVMAMGQVAPAELEGLLLTHPEIMDAAVIPYVTSSLPAFVLRKINFILGFIKREEIMLPSSFPWLHSADVFMMLSHWSDGQVPVVSIWSFMALSTFLILDTNVTNGCNSPFYHSWTLLIKIAASLMMKLGKFQRHM